MVYKDNVRKYRKKIRKMIEKKEDAQAIMNVFKEYTSAVDKAQKKSIFHKNNGARKKSRINKMIKNYAKAS
jgi:small subunit ribosomal protein S20